MTKMKIAQKWHPFSHEKGEQFLLPNTWWCVRVFPTKFFYMDMQGKRASGWIQLDLKGPVRWTAQLDWERGYLQVFGSDQQGPFHFCILEKEGEVILRNALKRPLSVSGSLLPPRVLGQHEGISLGREEKRSVPALPLENLFLGCHKAQDLVLMRRRLNLSELAPLWLRAAAFAPDAPAFSNREGNFKLLEESVRLVEEGKRDQIEGALLSLFCASFTGGFVPRLFDTEYQGLSETADHFVAAPSLLLESAACVRALFVQERDGVVCVLPCLPSTLHSGRMIHVAIEGGAHLHFEWSKKTLREVWIDAGERERLELVLPKGISSCRLKEKKGNLKKNATLKGRSLVLSLKKQGRVILDHFEG